MLDGQGKEGSNGHAIHIYKEAFSFRDEIATCSDTEVEIAVMVKSSFLIGPFHVKEEDKTFIDKGMKHLCYLGLLKEEFPAYCSAVMLISRKVTQDKRVVTDFRYLNVIPYLRTYFHC